MSDTETMAPPPGNETFGEIMEKHAERVESVEFEWSWHEGIFRQRIYFTQPVASPTE